MQERAFDKVCTAVLRLQSVFQEVRTASQKNTDAAEEIYRASEQQSAAMAQAVTAVSEVHRGAEDATSGARAVEDATKALRTLALDLGNLLGT